MHVSKTIRKIKFSYVFYVKILRKSLRKNIRTYECSFIKIKLINIFFAIIDIEYIWYSKFTFGIPNLTEKRFKNVKESVFFDHLISFRLFIKESLVIKCEKPVLNCTGKSRIFKIFD